MAHASTGQTGTGAAVRLLMAPARRPAYEPHPYPRLSHTDTRFRRASPVQDGPGAGGGAGAGAAPGPGLSLEGLRVLVVEDEYLIAMMLEDTLASFGCEVVGAAANLAAARRAAEEGGFDTAVLDINLGGQEVYPVADILRARAVPFMFLTGYTEREVEPGYRDAPRMQKPLDVDGLRAMLTALVTH